MSARRPDTTAGGLLSPEGGRRGGLRPVLHEVLGVACGWLAMALVVIVLFVAGSKALGAEQVLQEGTYDASSTWIVLTSAFGLLGALIGGVVCGFVARTRRAGVVLSAFVFVMGAATAFSGADAPEPPARPADESGAESIRKAAEYGREPLVTRVLNPIIGLAGVLAGGALVRRRTRDGAAGSRSPDTEEGR